MPFLMRMGANAIASLLIGYLLPQGVNADGVGAGPAAALVLGLRYPTSFSEYVGDQ